jgi:predicted SprT family Zn-dependent metalloprotease
MKPENEPLPEDVVALLTPFFPELDLSRIRVCEGIQRYVRGGPAGPVGYADRYKIYFAPGVYHVDTIEGLALIAHEVAHCLQYQRHGAWRFRARYLAAYFKNRLRGMSHLKAYRSIPFEIEAREAEEQVYRALKTLQSGLLETL